MLDGSRVHPETYEWARKMAVDALEIDDAADPTSALEEILQNPDKLKVFCKLFLLLKLFSSHSSV